MPRKLCERCGVRELVLGPDDDPNTNICDECWQELFDRAHTAPSTEAPTDAE